MKLKRRSLFHTALIGVPLVLLAAFGLQGFRSGWHGHGDPERLEKKMKWIEEELAEDLDLRPEQREAFQTLSGQYRALAREWAGGWRETLGEVNAELQKDASDAGRVSSLVKEGVRHRPSNEVLEALIDETFAFYETLDAEQQEGVRRRISRRLSHHF